MASHHVLLDLIRGTVCNRSIATSCLFNMGSPGVVAAEILAIIQIDKSAN